jgi:hypothetical protein
VLRQALGRCENPSPRQQQWSSQTCGPSVIIGRQFAADRAVALGDLEDQLALVASYS